MGAVLRVKKWDEFQHYKERNPPWIKLHKGYLDNYEFQRLPVDSRALAPMIWLLASETKDGSIDYDLEKIGFRIRMSALELEAALVPLISGGFLELDGVAIEPLAPRLQDAMPETEAETQEQTEEETDSAPQAAAEIVKHETILAGDEVSKALEAWNELADECDLSRVQAFNASRRKKVRKRLTECDGLEGWMYALSKIRGSPFLRGQSKQGWRITFDFFLKPENFTKIIEGNYDGKPTGGNGVMSIAQELLSPVSDSATVQ